MKIVKTKLTSLSSPFSASDTSFVLQDFLDSQGHNPVLADFGVEGYFIVVLKQSNVTEMVKCTSFSVAADGKTTFTVASNGRDILPKSPYTGSATGQDFAAGADAIITNDPLTMSRFATLAEDQSFTGKNTFAQVPSSSADPVDPTDLTRLSYVQALVLGTLTTLDVIVPGVAGATVAAGQLVYFDTVSGQWKLTSASTPTTVNNVLLGIAQGAGTLGGAIANGILLQGVDTHQTGMSTGAVQYAGNTSGAIVNTPGTTNVVVGLAKTATNLYFAPRFDQQLTQDQMNAMVGKSGTAPSASNKFEDESDTSAVAAANKLIRANSSGLIDPSFLASAVKFGGSGADGALSIASGTTTINVGAVQIYVLQYSSISITGTGSLAFSNPHANGTTVIILCSGNAVITSSATAAIDLRGMGAAGGTAGTAGASGGDGTNSIPQADDTAHNGFGGAASNIGTPGGAGAAGVAYSPISMYTRLAVQLASRMTRVAPGAGGGGGGGANSSGSANVGAAGGRGGGALIMQVAGSLNFTGTIKLDGSNGSDAPGQVTSNTNIACGGGGGGGAGGMGIILYNAQTAISGTITCAGGTGGAGGTAQLTATSAGGTSIAGGAGGGGAGADGAGGAGGTSPGTDNVGNAGASGNVRRAGGGGGAGGSCSNGSGGNPHTRAGGAGGSGGASENVLVAQNYFFT